MQQRFPASEELEADRRAAVIVGSEAFRDTLLKVESLSRFSARLSWHERLAQLQTQTFSAWLTQEFSKLKPVDPSGADRAGTGQLFHAPLPARPPGRVASNPNDARASGYPPRHQPPG